MGRPKGSKNKLSEFDLKVIDNVVINHPNLVPRVGFVSIDSQPDLVLTLRRITVGSFAGLWELRKINSDGTTKVLTDANTKLIAANLARNEIVKCGT